MTESVGIRALQQHASAVVARVARGETVEVTDRGRPVARLVPFGSTSAVDRGIADGWIEAPRRTRLDRVTRHRSDSSVLDVLDEDRG